MKWSQYKKAPGMDWSEYIAGNGCGLVVIAVFIVAAIGIAMAIIAWLLGAFGYTIVHTAT